MWKIILALLLSLLLSSRAEALSVLSLISAAEITNNEIILNFPETATFRATVTGEADITSVVLEYGDEQQTCGEVIAKAYPQFTAAKTVSAEWVWKMRQSGSLPPGAIIWWRWRVMLLLVGVIILGVVLGRQNRNEGPNVK